ncbi:MAG: ABC transporter permease [Pseudonocardia sp.]
MLGYLARRLGAGAGLMMGASLISFLLLYAAPGRPAEAVIRLQIARDPTAPEITAFEQGADLDRGLPELLGGWIRMLAHGDLGDSIRTGEPVLEEFVDRFPATLELAGAAVLLAIVLAVPLGILAARRTGSAVDHGSRVFALLAISVPPFWLGLMLILIFSVELPWLPAFGRGGPENLLLPALTLCLGLAAILTRLLRTSMLETLGSNFVRTAHAKGVPEAVVLIKHGLPNALIPVVTIAGLQVGNLLTGTVIVESIFAWPGVGRFFVEAISARDYPVIQGFVLAFALIFVLVNLAVDILYAYLNPRVRYARG